MLQAEDNHAGMYALDGKPKTVVEAVDRLQFFQHSKQGRPPEPMLDVVRTVAPEEALPGTGMVSLLGKFRIPRAA